MRSDAQRRRILPLSATGYALALLTVAAAILRLIFLNSKSLWLDEGISAIRAAKTLGNLIRVLLFSDMNMALYQLILHWWMEFAGSSEISLRLPSVIFATATVPLIYALGVELCDRRVGLMAALLLSVNVSCIQYAQEARGYAMLMMLVTLSSLFFVRSIKRSSLTRLRAYVIAGPWAAYAQLFGILILPAQWLSLFLFPTDRKTRFRLTICIALVTLLSLPAIILAILGEYGQVSWVPATTANTVLRTFAMFAGLYWGDLRGALGRLLFSMYLVTIGIAVAGASKSQRPVVGYLLLSVVLPVGIALVVSIFKPLFVFRYLLICVPFFVLLASIGLMRIKPRALMAAITALIVVLSLFEDHRFYHNGPMQDWRGAVNFVAANAKPGDVLLVFPEWDKSPVDYYVGRLSGPAAFPVITDRLHTPYANTSTDPSVALRGFLAAHGVNSYRRVWVLTDAAHLDEPALRELEAGHQVAAGPLLAGLSLIRID